MILRMYKRSTVSAYIYDTKRVHESGKSSDTNNFTCLACEKSSVNLIPSLIMYARYFSHLYMSEKCFSSYKFLLCLQHT